MSKNLTSLGCSGLPVAEFLNLPESYSNYAFYNKLYPTHGEPLNGVITAVDLLAIHRTERFLLIEDLEVLFLSDPLDPIVSELCEKYGCLFRDPNKLLSGPYEKYYELIRVMEFRVTRLCKLIKHLMNGEEV